MSRSNLGIWPHDMFGLDPQSIASRAKASGQSVDVPTIGTSIGRGMIGFMIVSLGGFGPWVLFSGWFHRHGGEIGLYAGCLVAFLGLGGICLHRLIIGPGSLIRCYQIFSVAFIGYAVIWTVAYKALLGVTGGIVGGVLGMIAMGLLFAKGFGAMRCAGAVIVALAMGNLAGYFIGELAHNAVLGIVSEKTTRALLSKIAWGLCYGLGFGAGIGMSFYACQAEARRLLARP